MENANGRYADAPPPPPRKSNTWKWVLGGCLGATVLGVLAIIALVGFIKKVVTFDSAKVEAAALEMLEFEAPEGLKGAFAMSLLGMKMAMLLPEEGFQGASFALTLMRFPDSAETDPEEMQRTMREQLENQGQGGDVERELEPETFTVRGEELQATVQVARQKTGERVRQYFLFLEGKDGPVMLMLMGSAEGLDHEAVQAFLDTVR